MYQEPERRVRAMSVCVFVAFPRFVVFFHEAHIITMSSNKHYGQDRPSPLVSESTPPFGPESSSSVLEGGRERNGGGGEALCPVPQLGVLQAS